MTGKIVHANGVPLCAETFGDPADSAILLIMGAASSMLLWEEEFCERVGAGGRFVLRYDHRDTGQSVTYKPGAPAYTFADLVDDAVGLLDAFSLSHLTRPTGPVRVTAVKSCGPSGLQDLAFVGPF